VESIWNLWERVKSSDLLQEESDLPGRLHGDSDARRIMGMGIQDLLQVIDFVQAIIIYKLEFYTGSQIPVLQVGVQSGSSSVLYLVNARGTQTRAGKCHGYGGVRVQIPISVPPPNPYLCEGVCEFLKLK
jgi:hypothetical protein